MEKNSGKVFRRREVKYLLTEEQYNIILPVVKAHTRPDEFGKSTVMNIYFDTPDYCLIRRSIEKPVYKEKLRLRSYSVPGRDTNVFLELKKKYDKIVYKRRESGSYGEMMEYLTTGKKEKGSQILREIDYFVGFYRNLCPAMFISYDREAYFDTEDEGVRISFDSDITYRDYDLRLDYGVYGSKLLNKGEHLMEIKIPSAIPVWLAKLLDIAGARRHSFSKYGKAYSEVMNCKQKEVKKHA